MEIGGGNFYNFFKIFWCQQMKLGFSTGTCFSGSKTKVRKIKALDIFRKKRIIYKSAVAISYYSLAGPLVFLGEFTWTVLLTKKD